MNHICFPHGTTSAPAERSLLLKTFVNGLLSIIFKAFRSHIFRDGNILARGCKYCPIVKTETPACKTSSINSSTSSSVSPSPTMIPVLATTPRSAIRRKTDKLTSYLAALRTCGLIRRTVSILWEIISGAASTT